MLLKGGLLALLTIAIYLPAMRADFAYDDAHFVRSNDIVRHGGFHLDSGRLMTLATYRLNFITTGDRPVFYHLTNLLIHLGTTAMVFLLARSLLALANWQALLTTGVFAVHPLASEAVIYISGRSELLACFFILLSVFCFSRNLRIFALLAFILAVGSKEIALVTPVLWWMTAQLQKRPAWPIVGCLAAGFLMSYPRQYLEVIRENANWGGFYAILSLLGRAIVPLNLNIDHDFTGLPKIMGILSLAILIAALAVGIRFRHRAEGFAALWIVVLLIPHAFVEPAGYLAEHHFYAPMFGIALLLTLTLKQGLYFTDMSNMEALAQ